MAVWPSARANTTSGASSGWNQWIRASRSVSTTTHWIKCSAVMGWVTEPTSTFTRLPSTVTAGTCFSWAASVTPASSTCISSPQHFTGTWAEVSLVMTLPQCLQI